MLCLPINQRKKEGAKKMNPHQVVKEFERAVAEYTGAPYVVAVNSCSAALMLAVAWHLRPRPALIGNLPTHLKPESMPYTTQWFAKTREECPAIEIPKRTYVSVPMSIIHAGGRPTFRDEEWLGAYPLLPLNVWDSARWFTSDLWRRMPPSTGSKRIPADRGIVADGVGMMICTSHHWSKTLGIQQGGCILHDAPEADAWLRRARFDGRTEGVAPKDDNITQVGWHCYMSPEVAAEGLVRLHFLPKHNAPLPNDQYPDLSQLEIFK